MSNLDFSRLDVRVPIGILIVTLAVVVIVLGCVCIAQGIKATPKKETVYRRDPTVDRTMEIIRENIRLGKRVDQINTERYKMVQREIPMNEARFEALAEENNCLLNQMLHNIKEINSAQ